MNKHLYLDFENNEREEINSACDLVSGELSDDKSMILRLRRKLMITGLN